MPYKHLIEKLKKAKLYDPFIGRSDFADPAATEIDRINGAEVYGERNKTGSLFHNTLMKASEERLRMVTMVELSEFSASYLFLDMGRDSLCA